MDRAPVVSVELLLDADSEAAVRTEWEALAGAGLSSLAPHTSESNRPHVTLLVRSELAPLDASALVRRAFPVVLGAPILFGDGDRRVLARQVIPTSDLLELHRAVHERAGVGDDAPHTTPGAWTPHVTLARRLRLVDVGTALSLVGGDLTATAVGLRRWDAATRTVSALATF